MAFSCDIGGSVRIPVSFKLMGQTIRVTRREMDFVEATDRVAFASYRTNEIQLNPSLGYRSQDQVEHAFLHELMHFIIYHSQDAYKGKAEYMHQEEGFIDLSAHLLHQALTTMEYADE